MTRVRRVPLTYFADAECVSIDIIREQAAVLRKSPLISKLLDPLVNCVFIVNQQRQIVYVSRSVEDLMSEANERLLGLRLGDALGCVHAREAKGGCGTARACRDCGAVQAMLSSLAGRADSKPFKLTRLIGLGDRKLELLVTTMPLFLGNEKYVIFTFVDRAQHTGIQDVRRLFRGR